MEYNENGSPGIKFDSPESKPADKPDKTDKPADKPEEPEEPEKEKSKSEKCVCDTGKVDRELKKLREKAERLEQQLRSASGGEARSSLPPFRASLPKRTTTHTAEAKLNLPKNQTARINCPRRCFRSLFPNL